MESAACTRFGHASYLWAERWAAWPERRTEAGGRKARVSTTEPSFLWTTRWDAEQRGPTPTHAASSVRMLSGRRAASVAAGKYPATPRPGNNNNNSTREENGGRGTSNQDKNRHKRPGVCTQAPIFWTDIPHRFQGLGWKSIFAVFLRSFLRSTWSLRRLDSSSNIGTAEENLLRPRIWVH